MIAVENNSAKIVDAAKEDADAPKVSAQLRGETMAYAAQSAVYNMGANFFEPYVNFRVQKYYSGKDPLHHTTHGNYTQNLIGEFAGDIAGASTLMLAEAIAPEHLHACSRKMRSWVDPFYSKLAEYVFANEKSAPDYEEKVDKWKTFQERNLVRSSIIGAAGIAGNIITQKALLGNPSPVGLIFAGKLASTALTTAIGLTIRMAYPEQTKRMDKWVSSNVFAPMLSDTGGAAPATHVERLSQQSEMSPEQSR